MKNNINILISALFGLLMLWGNREVHAQPIIAEQVYEAAGLLCFQVYGDSNSYRYLPNRGGLTTGENNLPEFSMLRYVLPKKSASNGIETISEADGGGIVHFLVKYDTDPNQVRQAEIQLKQKLKNKELKLVGPVVFNKGSYSVISSILNADGDSVRSLLGLGKAPVFQNSKVAFSFPLSVLNAKLMMESFKMATPDVSVMFDMEFEGVTQAYQAELTVNWEEVQKSEYIREKTSALFYSKTVEKTFGELFKSGAVELKTFGNDSILDPLLNVAYDRLLNMMFNPVQPAELPKVEDQNFLGNLFSPDGFLGGVFGASRAYKLKQVKTSGVTTLKFNSSKKVKRNHLITFNIGPVYKKHGDNPLIFRDAVLDDPTFDQREVFISIDGDLKEAFEGSIKNVSIAMRKKHQGGAQSLEEVFLDKDRLKNYNGPLSMIYLNKEDEDRFKWLEYQYQLIWNFGANGSYKAPWKSQTGPSINLYAPYKQHEIFLDGDWSLLESRNVRAVSIEVNYPFFGKEKRERVTLRSNEDASNKTFQFILPEQVNEVSYTITWFTREGERLSKSGTDEYGLIFFDELPE